MDQAANISLPRRKADRSTSIYLLPFCAKSTAPTMDEVEEPDRFYEERQRKLDTKGYEEIQRSLDKRNDRSMKIQAERRIAQNWDCTLRDILPTHLQPRSRVADGRFLAVNHNNRAGLPPERWSRTFKSSLLRLSSNTLGDRAFAYAKLSERVRDRQRGRTHPQHYARKRCQSQTRAFKNETRLTTTSGELLKSDVDAVIKDVRNKIDNGSYVPRKNQTTINDVRSGRSVTPQQAWECSDESDGSVQEDDLAEDENMVEAGFREREEEGEVGPTLDEVRAYLLAGDD